MADDASYETQLSPELQSRFFWGVAAIGGVSLAASLPFDFLNVGIHFWDYFTLRYSHLIFLTDLAYFAASWQRVHTKSVGGMTILEHPVSEEGPGWKFVPFGAGKLLQYPVETQEVQFPADPEQISKRLDKEGLKVGEFRPMRIVSGVGNPENKTDDILNERTAVELTFSVRWKVNTWNFFEFWIRIPGNTWAEKKASIEKQMRDTGEGELAVLVSKIPAGAVTSNLNKLNKKLRRTLEKDVRGWGITIEECRLQSPDYGDGISHALAAIPVANANAKVTVINAEAKKKKDIIESEGEATAIQNRLEAKGIGLKKAAGAAGIDVEKYRNGSLAPKVLGDKTVLLGEAGAVSAMGFVKTVVEGMSK